MFFTINRGDRTGAILQNILHIYAFCYQSKIAFTGIYGNSRYINNTFCKLLHEYYGIKMQLINQHSGENITRRSEEETWKIFWDVENNPQKYYTKEFITMMKKQMKKYPETQKKTLAVHIRRGDVNKNNQHNRYDSDEFYLNLINKIKSEEKDELNIHVFSEQNFNGNISLFKDYNLHLASNTEYHPNYEETIFNDIYQLTNADFLIMSKSSFSLCAAILNTNKCYMPPSKLELKHYIKHFKWIV